jgi:hypothetical protein
MLSYAGIYCLLFKATRTKGLLFYVLTWLLWKFPVQFVVG